MSWAVAHEALVSFFQQIPGTGKVYAYWPRVAANPDQPAFRAVFCDEKERLNFSVIKRIALNTEKSSEDSLSYSRTYRVEIESFFALSSDPESEFEFQALLDNITDAFEQLQDRSLGGKILTLSPPDWSQIKLVKWYGNTITCHQVQGLMDVEVVETAPSSPPLVFPSIPVGIPLRQLEIGNALLDFLRIKLSPLSLKSIDWAKSVISQPGYPADPKSACPRLLLRAYTVDVEPIASHGHDSSMTFSLFFQRCQVPGTDHQVQFLQELKLISESLLQKFNPGTVKQAGADFCRPTQIVIHDEQSHPHIDDPTLRISVGEIVILVNSSDRY